MSTTVDVLAIAPHPDDAELHCAGTLLELAAAGRRIGILDLTRGELSTRGDAATRIAETEAASRVLGLHARRCCALPDGGLAPVPEQKLAVVRALRALRPRTVLLPWIEDRHPDHVNAGLLVREAVFLSGLARIETQEDGNAQEPHRPGRAYHYMMTHDVEPRLIVDISASFERKMEAIRCYASQFWTGEEREGPETYISSRDFMESLIGRSRRFGFVIGCTYAECFLPVQPFGVRAAVLDEALHP